MLLANNIRIGKNAEICITIKQAKQIPIFLFQPKLKYFRHRLRTQEYEKTLSQTQRLYIPPTFRLNDFIVLTFDNFAGYKFYSFILCRF